MKYVARSLLLAACVTGLSGCSVIGFFAGSIIDGNKADMEDMRVEETIKLDSGDRIRIVLADSTIIEGVYEQSASLDSAAYVERYAAFLDQVRTNVDLPRLGDTLTLHSKARAVYFDCVFRGFGVGTLILERVDQQLVTNLRFSHLTTIECTDGRVVDQLTLERMSKAGQLPRSVAFDIKTKTGNMHVALDDVSSIEKNNPGNARWVGLGLGLAVDAAALATLSSGLSWGFSGSSFK